MKIKEIIIGAFSTLVVTVLAGVAVYYWTKEPDSKKTEILEYSVEQVAQFKGNAGNLGLTTIKVNNKGGIAAAQVKLIVDYPNAVISDSSFDSTSGVKPKLQAIDKSKAELSFDSLLPQDSFALSLLTTIADMPKISLRSAGSIGKPIVAPVPLSLRKQKLNQVLGYAIPLSALISLLLLVAAYRLTSRKPKVVKQYNESKNSTGFLLLHQGAIQEAEPLLRAAVMEGEEGAYALSNLAYCLALSGNVRESKTMLAAAKFFVSALGGIAVVSFNEALIALLNDSRDEFYRKLKEAMELDKEEVKRYCDYSVHLEPIKSEQRYLQIITVNGA